MSRIAVIGAGGFVGMHLAERAWLGNEFDLVPVVRSPKSFARLSKYGRPCLYADAGDPVALGRAIDGCDAVVNLTMGDNARMLPDTQAILEACEAAKVRVLVHTSSAEVFGRAEDPGLHDDSPPPSHWMEYARAKASAEAWLRSRIDSTPVGVVTVRPGLIWGPRSPWVVGPAVELLAGTAVLFGGGDGIANLIHLDNLGTVLIHLARCRTVKPGFYNIADEETIRWKEYFAALAREMGLESPRIHSLPFSAWSPGILSRLGGLKDAPFLRPLKKSMRHQTKWHLKASVLRAMSVFRRPAPPGPPGPNITQSQWWLQGTRHKLPTAKLREAYPGIELVPFPEGLRRTGEWMRFAGFAA